MTGVLGFHYLVLIRTLGLVWQDTKPIFTIDFNRGSKMARKSPVRAFLRSAYQGLSSVRACQSLPTTTAGCCAKARYFVLLSLGKNQWHYGFSSAPGQLECPFRGIFSCDRHLSGGFLAQVFRFSLFFRSFFAPHRGGVQ